MILEVALLNVRSGESPAFEQVHQRGPSKGSKPFKPLILNFQTPSQGKQRDGEKPPIAGRIGVESLWRFPAAGRSGPRIRREPEGTWRRDVPSVY